MLLILICLLFSTQLIAQQYYTKKGKVSFFSEAPIENISAININKKPRSKTKPSDHTPIELEIN